MTTIHDQVREKVALAFTYGEDGAMFSAARCLIDGALMYLRRHQEFYVLTQGPDQPPLWDNLLTAAKALGYDPAAEILDGEDPAAEILDGEDPCAEGHQNDGEDVCTRCGEDLNPPTEDGMPKDRHFIAVLASGEEVRVVYDPGRQTDENGDACYVVDRPGEDLTEEPEDDRVFSSSDFIRWSEECKCPDCGWMGPENALKPAADLALRVAPGEPMPAGECPECGALCHVKGG